MLESGRGSFRMGTCLISILCSALQTAESILEQMTLASPTRDETNTTPSLTQRVKL